MVIKNNSKLNLSQLFIFWHEISLSHLMSHIKAMIKPMLRITAEQSNGQTCLMIEGRLIGPWVAELNAVVNQTGTRLSAIQLDLAKVHFVNTEGLSLLQALQLQGVTFSKVSPFIHELLKSRAILENTVKS